MMNLVDVLPTLVEVAGGHPPTDVDGQSFADVLAGKRPEHRERIFTTHSGDGRMNAYPIRSLRTSEWKYIRNLRPDGEHTTHIDRGEAVDGNAYWRSWVEQAAIDAKAAEIVKRYHRRPPEELYDLRADPHEQHNLSADPRHASTLKQLRTELDEWLREQGDQGAATEEALSGESH
jgi:arylsulfatase A-like enzyme